MEKRSEFELKEDTVVDPNEDQESCHAFDAVFNQIKVLQTLQQKINHQNIAALEKCKKELENLFNATKAAKNDPLSRIIQ